MLDPFSGSATTLAVAKKLGRRFLGFDLSPDYVKRGTVRLADTRVGDALDGAPEPTMSAPSTATGRRLEDKVNGVAKSNGHAKANGAAHSDSPRRRNAAATKVRIEPAMPLFDSLSDQPTKRPAAAKPQICRSLRGNQTPPETRGEEAAEGQVGANLKCRLDLIGDNCQETKQQSGRPLMLPPLCTWVYVYP